MKTLITGGNTTLGRFVVEALYLAVSAGIPAIAAYILANPNLFTWESMIGVRLVLGFLANLTNENLSKF